MVFSGGEVSVNRSKLNTESLGLRNTRQDRSPPLVVIHIFGSIMMPTCKALQVWLKRPEIHSCGKNQIVMIKPSMPRQGSQVMLFLVILNGFFLLFPREDKGVSYHGLAI
jgi:hypothetical protein